MTEIPIDDFTSVAINSQSDLLYASSSYEKISVINGSSNEVIDTIYVNGTSIKSLNINPTTAKIYAVTEFPDGIIVIDLNKKIRDSPDIKENQTTVSTSTPSLLNTHSYEVKQLSLSLHMFGGDTSASLSADRQAQYTGRYFMEHQPGGWEALRIFYRQHDR